MSKVTSPYYPPRARWYAPVFYFFGSVRRTVALDRIHLPPSITWPGLFKCFLIPSYGFYLRGPRALGKNMMAICALLFLIFIAWLGHSAANIAFGMIVSIHVSGIVYYCDSFLREWTFGWRILFTIATLIGVGFLIYSPLRSAIQNHWLMPVQMNGRVIILEKSVSAAQIHRGDWVGYTLSGYRFSNHMGNGLWGGSQLGLGPVLAVAGDRVEFTATNFLVNGTPETPWPHMPTSGTVTVAPNHWLIWPTVSISGNWNAGENNISGAMLEMSDVPESQFIGKPLKHWFWRKQILP